MIGLLILLLCGLSVVAFLLRLALLPIGGSSGAATCGRCGYEIADLVDERCSECGEFLLDVGITGSDARQASLTAGLIGWTILVLVTAPFYAISLVHGAAQLTGMWNPTRHINRVSTTMFPLNEQGTPDLSGPRVGMRINSVTVQGQRLIMGDASVYLHGPDRTVEFTIDLEKGLVRSANRASGEPLEVERDAVSLDLEGLWREAGVDEVPSGLIRGLRESIVEVIRTGSVPAAPTGYRYSLPRGAGWSSTGAGYAPQFEALRIPIAVAMVAAVWVLGALPIWLRWRAICGRPVGWFRRTART